MFNSDYPEIEEAAHSSVAWRRFQARLTLEDRELQRRQIERPHSCSLFIKGAAHGDLADELFTVPLVRFWKLWTRPASDRLRFRAIIDAYLTSFFDIHLRDRMTNTLVTRTPSPYPEVVVLAKSAGAEGWSHSDGARAQQTR